MKLLKARVTPNGQVTLPKVLRETMGIIEGDQIQFKLISPYKASLSKPKLPGASAGIMNHLSKIKTPTNEEINRSIREIVSEKYKKQHSGS